MQTIFLTGATGYIGGSIAALLVAGGTRVRGLVRTQEKAALLVQRGVEPILGSLDDAALLAREAAAADGVINAASSDHAEPVRALMAGLEGSGKPLLHTSGSSVIGDEARGAFRSEAVFDEATPLAVPAPKQPRRDIDLMVLAAAARGVRSAVICPGMIYGTGSGLHRHSAQIPFLAANAKEHGAVQIVGAGLNVWSNVHIDDVAALYLLALAKAPPGAFYFAENGEASFGAIAAAIATRLGLAGLECLRADVAAARWGESKAVYSLGSNSRVRSVRARSELGWAPRQTSVIDWIMREMPVA